MRTKLFLTLLILSLVQIAHANVIMPKIFSDNMVIQRNEPIPVWGWSDKNEKIQIKFCNQIVKTKADASGNWKVVLNPENSGGPFNMIIQGKNQIIIKNILIGEVWLCSGQSNMEWTVEQSKDFKISKMEANNPFIRHIKVPRAINSAPNKDIPDCNWDICDSTSVGRFTAVGYFFAKQLYDSLKIPVGLINSSWGGTNVETWISRDGFKGNAEFKKMIESIPEVNLDSLVVLNLKESSDRIKQLQGSPLFDKDSLLFKNENYVDRNWPTIMQPALWESQEPGEIDGVVWIRKKFELNNEDLKSEALLELSTIDDEDITYVNGVEIGRTNLWNIFRKYFIPPGILKKGTNTIAIRIVDTGGGGGIYGDPENVRLKLGEKTIPLSGKWSYRVLSLMESVEPNNFPSLCYNAMIFPLIPYPFRGVLWYQGESNAGRAYQYRTSFPLLIEDWRKKWNANFPFYFVQLATFRTSGNSNEGCDWAELREAQSMTLNKVSNTGMCVTTDIGDPVDIHPQNKQDVGYRLSRIALNNIYGKNMIYSGPIFKSMKINGKTVILSFENIGSGLMTPDKYGYLKGFEIAGEDRVFHFARGYITENSVILESDKVINPVAVRFGWIGDASECNLFNKEGFPASPFRTDDWKTLTKNEKYRVD
ncbi:MAG: sialate O-acetylesterase [Deltaproteobacteria bacterium]